MGEGWLVFKLLKSRNGTFLVGILEQIWLVWFCKHTLRLSTLATSAYSGIACATSTLDASKPISISFRLRSAAHLSSVAWKLRGPKVLCFIRVSFAPAYNVNKPHPPALPIECLCEHSEMQYTNDLLTS
jgi:hypothetical protein